MRRAKRARGRGRGGARRGERGEEGYTGSFCAICGKKAGECEHRRLIIFLGEHGEFAVAE